MLLCFFGTGISCIPFSSKQALIISLFLFCFPLLILTLPFLQSILRDLSRDRPVNMGPSHPRHRSGRSKHLFRQVMLESHFSFFLCSFFPLIPPPFFLSDRRAPRSEINRDFFRLPRAPRSTPARENEIKKKKAVLVFFCAEFLGPASGPRLPVRSST